MIKKLKTHTFNKHVYSIEHQSKIRGRDLGECDFENRVLRIPFDGDTLGELDCDIHEAMHACFPYLAEDEIEESATCVASLLWRLGWRYNPDPE